MTARGPAIERMRRWFDTLTATKRDLARRDPDLFATYLQPLEDSPGMVDVHVGALLDQLKAIVAQGTIDGTVASTDPHTTALAAFHAMSRFHHPLHVGYWQISGHLLTEHTSAVRVSRSNQARDRPAVVARLRLGDPVAHYVSRTGRV